MKTFLAIYGFLQITTIFWWIYIMLLSKPKYLNGRNRFMRNWNEGGKLTLITYSFLGLLLSLAVLIIIAVFNVLISLV